MSRVLAKLASGDGPGARRAPCRRWSSRTRIDDVPILTLTLHGGGYGSDELRAMATHLDDELATIPDLARIDLIGGEPTQLRVTLDPARLAGERRDARAR